MLVGFGTRINSQYSCYCYFSGGVAPSFIPPQGSEYRNFQHDGNGPIMKTRLSDDLNYPRDHWNCFVYAQGTGSPTASGATHAPITPSPTGSITHAPTPVGIASFAFVGRGYCDDSNNEKYNEISGLSGVDKFACSQFCGQFPSSNLVGFTHSTGLFPSCHCHFSGQVPAPPSGSGWFGIKTTQNGTGPIKRGDSSNYNRICYAYPQGTGSLTPIATINPTAIPTASPTLSPTTAALSFFSFGPGRCADANNLEYSQFELALGVNATASECNSACSTGFKHPMLVGFGTRINTVTSCYCYFSGGAEPSIIPPKEFRYQKYVHPGNGPIMNTQQVADFNCFVYAQGTGSPTAAGATHSPVTPSPTGSTTQAPTPVGIASYVSVGPGFCHDSNDQRYSYILGLLGNVSATRCSQFCAQYTSPSLVGFSRDIRPQNYYRCYCLYSGGAIPAPPSGSDWAAIQNENKGTGPISSVSNDPSYECYAFPQGTGSPTGGPTAGP
eukprot:scaffold5752_cov54-Cyclotella_meneghiniana.AAC.6